MDNSVILSKLYSSFDTQIPTYEPPKPYVDETGPSPDFDLKIKYTDKIKEIDSELKPTKPIMGNSIFMDRFGLELANLDAVFNVTNSKFGFLGSILPQKIYDGQSFVFACLGGTPGGFVQYLQYRLTRCQGFGISKNEYNRNGIEFNGLNTFTVLDGTNDRSGDIFENLSNMYDRIHKYNINGLDLIVANPVTESKNYFKYLISQTLLGLKLLSKKGRFVIKIPESMSERILEFMYIFQNAFKEFYIFNPFASGFDSSRYLIGKHIKDASKSISAFENIISKYKKIKKGHGISSLMKDVNSQFKKYVMTQNDLIDKFELDYNQENYNLNRLYYYWDVPSHGQEIYKRF